MDVNEMFFSKMKTEIYQSLKMRAKTTSPQLGVLLRADGVLRNPLIFFKASYQQSLKQKLRGGRGGFLEALCERDKGTGLL